MVESSFNNQIAMRHGGGVEENVGLKDCLQTCGSGLRVQKISIGCQTHFSSLLDFLFLFFLFFF